VKLAAGGEFGADFVTDEDVAQALIMVLETGTTGPYNVASGKRSTLRNIADQLAELTDTPQGRILIADRDQLEMTDVGFPAIDNRKLIKLGFRPTALAVGLETLVDALRQGVD